MNVLKLKLPDAQYDLVLANGLQAYLNPDQFITYYSQIARVLKPGGRYYEYLADAGSLFDTIYSTSPWARLVSTIVDLALRFTHAHLYQTVQKRSIDIDFKNLSLDHQGININGAPYHEHVMRLVRI